MKFDELAALLDEIESILGLQVPSLSAYFTEGDEPGFSHLGGEAKQSKASTATCVSSLLATDRWQSDWSVKSSPDTPWARRGQEIADTLLFGKWASSGLPEQNVFTTSFILEAASKLLLGTRLDARTIRRIKLAQQVILEGPEKEDSDSEFKGLKVGAARVYRYRESAFLTQVAYRALRASSLLPGCGLGDLSKRLTKARAWARSELVEQLALRQAGSRNADFFELIYAAMLVSELTGGRLSPSDATMVRAALAGFFDSQLDNGAWPRSLPLFHYPKVGAAFCYEYELLAELLECAPLRAEILPFLPQLSLAARRAIQVGIPIGDRGRGWTSGHHRHIQEPESWSTASVFHFFQALGRVLSEAMRQQAFHELGQVYAPPTEEIPTTGFASNMLDCPLRLDQPDSSLKAEVEARFLAPLRGQRQRVARGRPFANDVATSALLYGPPGTSKTELAQSTADYLGWPLLKIDPSHLVKSGMDRIQAEADALFHVLAHLEEVVVLLDEIDELVRDRGRATELQSRFLTTSMLPKLTALQTRRRIVWIAATNYLESFDLAIRRRGRFDIVAQVLPPTAAAKQLKWDVFRDFVERSEDAEAARKLALLTFAEAKNLAGGMSKTSSLKARAKLLAGAVDTSTLHSTDGHETASESASWEKICNEQAAKQRWSI